MESPPPPPLDLEAHLSQPAAAYLETNDHARYALLSSTLASLAQTLSRSSGYRHTLSLHHPSSLHYLVRLGSQLFSRWLSAASRSSALSADEKRARLSSSTPRAHYDAAYRDVQVLVVLFRCCRNAMARCPAAQEAVVAHLDEALMPMLVHLTAFAALTEPDLVTLTRTCAQMLCNLATANADTAQIVWRRAVLANKREERIVHRLLTSPDTPTQLAAKILVINLLKQTQEPRERYERCLQLCSDGAGVEIVETMLALADSIVLQTSSHPDDDDGEGEVPQQHQPHVGNQGARDAEPLNQMEESLRMINEVVTILFSNGMASRLLEKLGPSCPSPASAEGNGSDRPLVTASQLSLLKLLDSWLHFAVASPDDVALSPYAAASEGGLEGLVSVFLELSSFVRAWMEEGLRDESSLDRRVVGVHQVLLVVLQCLLSLGLAADGFSLPPQTTPGGIEEQQGWTEFARRYLANLRQRDEVVDELVALLHQTALFAPAVSPFASATPTSSAARRVPEGHVLSSTGQAGLLSPPSQCEGETERYGFDLLKRDVVRVLGALVYNPAPNHADTALTPVQIRHVQDRVREKGGLFDVLNMTVLDVRNPYMREHAIFTLRYLLASNRESQEMVARLQPLQQDGEAKGGVQLPFV
ncbi:hypothetical protein ACQY0O_001093 [Thecaphora frezii]